MTGEQLVQQLRAAAQGNYNPGELSDLLSQAATAVERLLVLRPHWPTADHGSGSDGEAKS